MSAYKTLSVAMIVILGLGLGGCGSSDSYNDSPLSSPEETATDIVVERGPVIDATVKDSEGNRALPKEVGSNTYTFASPPVYPISVYDGWIDTNGNLVMDEDDLLLDTLLLSYSTVVTPLTTYLSYPDETVRNQRKMQLLEEMDIDNEADLFALPSQATPEVIALNNAVFKTIKEHNSVFLNEAHYSDLNFSYTEYTHYIDQALSKATSAEIAAYTEEKTIKELATLGKVKYLDQLDMVHFQEKREVNNATEPPPPSNEAESPGLDYDFMGDFGFTRDDAVEIVTEISTGLQWQDNEDAKTAEKNWEEAEKYCEALTLGGHSDWRLPNLGEMFSIVHWFNKPMIKNAFKNAAPSNYWFVGLPSSEGYIIRADDIEWDYPVNSDDIVSPYPMRMHFGNLSISKDDELSYNHVRCVRGGEPPTKNEFIF